MLMRWDPFAEMSRLQGDVGRLVGAAPAGFRPAVDIEEHEGSIVIMAEVPGLKADDLDVQIEDRVLTLSGERKLERVEEDGRRFRRVERAHGSFQRSFLLPETVDGSAIDAELADGVLTVRLPKRSSQEKRRVEVKSLG